MTNDMYSSLLAIPCHPFSDTSICETSATYQFIRERHLQVIWLEQKYFRQLTTLDGAPIIILSPGIWNGEAGPDFLKAHIKIGDQEFKGDIEIHLNDESWYLHQHHLDKKYNQVILHISYWKPKVFQQLKTEEGKSLSCTYLEEKLTIPETRILKLIDLELYPYKHFVGSGTCANALFRNLGPQQIHRFFRQAATWRLEQKQLYLNTKINSSSDCLIGGMAMTLGYKYNAEKFLELFLLLKQQSLIDELSVLAYVIGLCGFFHEKYRRQWLKSIKYQTLAWRYDAMPNDLKNHNINLNLERTRPANHPIRRLAVLVKIFLDLTLANLYEALKSLWQYHWSSSNKKTWPALREALIKMLPNYRDKYWEHHYIFEEEEKQASITLLGRDLKSEILINIFLPLLFKDIKTRNDPMEKEAFFNFYSTFPAAKTKKGTYLMHRFFGDTQKRKILNKADMQQGAYQLHKDFCVHYEASCIGCPFVNRYQAIFENHHKETITKPRVPLLLSIGN